MNCEIICIGSELLHGDILNTNAQIISQHMASIGIFVHFHTVIGDNAERIQTALDTAYHRADLVICTGGLGPTRDDMTRDMIAQYFGRPLRYDRSSAEHIRLRIGEHMTRNNERQCYFPEGSIILHNARGTANAFLIDEENSGKHIVVSLPGPPLEMEGVLTDHVIPYLRNYSDGVTCAQKLVISGVGESQVETDIMDLVIQQNNPTIATFAGSGHVVARITAHSQDEMYCQKLIQPICEEITRRFRKNIYRADEGPTHKAARLLVDHKITFSVAESCTGGMITSTLVDYAGISEVLSASYITYSNEAKIRELNVSPVTLLHHGAVSEACAKEMAFGAAYRCGAKMGLSATGIAGPGSASTDKPVGLVYLCIYYKERYHVVKLDRAGSRQQIRMRAVVRLLDEIVLLLESEPEA